MMTFIYLIALLAVLLAGYFANRGLTKQLHKAAKPAARFVQYIHHGARVWVRADPMGKHRDHCLCHDCEKFKPGRTDNRLLANSLYLHCVDNDMVTPVWECKAFSQDEYAHCRPWNK